METLLVCEQCGSTDVDILAWIDINTNKYSGEGPNKDCWCNQCEEHVKVVTKKEFKSNQQLILKSKLNKHVH